MNEKQKGESKIWYNLTQHGMFDFQKEANLYCENNTDILMTACSIFRKEYIEETKVNPFSCITITSACMKIFVTNFFPPKTLAIPSPGNYRCQFKSYSSASIQW